MKIHSLSHSQLLIRYPKLASSEASILSSLNAMVNCYNRGGKVYICGNGGSAADAEHFSGELNKGFLLKRPLSKTDTELFSKINPEIPVNLQGALPAIPLTSFYSTVSAFQNDCQPKYSLAQLVWSLITPNDLFIGISTSGNSENVYYALQTAKAKKVQTILLTGENKGRCSEYSDIVINTPSAITHEIQEFHLPIYHAICIELEQYFFQEK